MNENCNIIEFLSDKSFVFFGEKLQTSSIELYGGYVQWCSQNGLTSMKRDSFTSWLKSNSKKYGIKYDCNIINRENRRVRGFKGIKTYYASIVI